MVKLTSFLMFLLLLASCNPFGKGESKSSAEDLFSPGFPQKPGIENPPAEHTQIESWDITSTNSANLFLSNSALLEYSSIDNSCVLKSNLTDESFQNFSAGALNGLIYDSGVLRIDSSNSHKAELHSSWTPNYSSIISYWKLNEATGVTTIADSKGSNNGVANNTLSNNAGKLNGALVFNGTNSHVSIGNPANLNIGTNDWTIQAWFKTSSVQAFQAIISKSLYGAAGGRWSIFMGDTCGVGKLAFLFAYTAALADVFCSPLTYNDGKWHYVVVTLKRNGFFYMYVDGAKIIAADISAKEAYSVTSGMKTYIGAYNDVSGNNPGYAFFDGLIDDVAIWNVALSEFNVKKIFENQKIKHFGTFVSRAMSGSLITPIWNLLGWTTTIPFQKNIAQTNELAEDYPGLVDANGVSGDSELATGMVGLWHLDESSGTIGADSIKDDSGKGGDGTPAGSLTLGEVGKLNKSAKFTNGTIDIDDSLYLRPEKISISAWVKPKSIPTWATVTMKTSIDSWSNGYGLANNGGGLAIDFWINDYSVNYVRAPMDLNVWQHVLATYDGAIIKMYRNGVMIDSKIYSGAISHSSNVLRIGSGTTSDGDAEYPWDGEIDEVAIWDRDLNEKEILQIYRRGANQLKFQVRTCLNSNCSDDVNNQNWIGPDGSSKTYYSELDNIIGGVVNPELPQINLTIPQKPYFQYRGNFESDDESVNCNYAPGGSWCSPELKSVSIGPVSFVNSGPFIETKNGISFLTLVSSQEIFGIDGCAAGIGYNLGYGDSYQNVAWYYYSNNNWVLASGDSSTMNSNTELGASNSEALSLFGKTFGSGKVFLRAFLKSNGTTKCSLKNFNFTLTK